MPNLKKKSMLLKNYLIQIKQISISKEKQTYRYRTQTSGREKSGGGAR